LRNLLSLCDKKKTNLADLEDELGFHLHESLSQQILSEWNFPISTASIVRYHESSRRQALPSLSSDTLKSVICVSTACQLARQLQKPIPYFPSATPVPDSHWRILNISKEHAEKLAKESLETFRATHHVLNP
jgi:HD-like signal output (HDOD) protein